MAMAASAVLDVTGVLISFRLARNAATGEGPAVTCVAPSSLMMRGASQRIHYPHVPRVASVISMGDPAAARACPLSIVSARRSPGASSSAFASCARARSLATQTEAWRDLAAPEKQKKGRKCPTPDLFIPDRLRS